MIEQFRDRMEAGERLADALADVAARDAVVLGLARGGVVVAEPVAARLGLPLRALIIRKIGAPQNPELALGAVSETGVRRVDPSIVKATGASDEHLQRETDAQVAEARRRQEQYGAGASLEDVRGKTAIIVDDGIATGASALVAVESARELGATAIVLATPVASPQAVRVLAPHVDRLVVLQAPPWFRAVGMHYTSFDQVSDEEVMSILRKAGEVGP